MLIVFVMGLSCTVKYILEIQVEDLFCTSSGAFLFQLVSPAINFHELFIWSFKMAQISSYISLPDLTAASNNSRVYKLYKCVPKSTSLFQDTPQVSGPWARTKSVPNLVLMNENDQNWLFGDRLCEREGDENDPNYVNMNPTRVPMSPCAKYLQKQRKTLSPAVINSDKMTNKPKCHRFEKQKPPNGKSHKMQQSSPIKKLKTSNLSSLKYISKSETNLHNIHQMHPR